MGPLCPFCPNTKGANHQPQGKVGPNPRVGLPEPILAPNSIFPKMAKRTPGPELAKNHILATFKPFPLETTRSHQLKSSRFSPPFRGRTLLHQWTPYQGFIHGAYMV
ncbi:hypothetical protein O181_079803 [Austropuccinia psidii MF-1]|uniref:Uncharacterized protein n=1 Tax=Austropuccinia psidii MF-1 TaxID=1389203 RepID=A0A9Q3FLR0_9BASI|nr:hypothetical protein [Austropuccinia psidii MF-1]